MADVLPDAEIADRMPDGWAREDDEIVRAFDFDGYLDASGFLSAAAGLAEDAWHHPEMTITWGEVAVRLTTHDAGGITEKDIDLAERLNGIYG
ncbi:MULTISPECIES: 4a-hydroxytetrahydrobiopterin dehydratase [Haloarcula]|uniref:4a-hydroxytetrahydrobiopterin dehydratase n=1 Tax=Haloarcula TaxID=2237 RepID=UPI0023ECD8E2|nr:4a-hydroxytetrahydrobiopterin dehydratase [Halomicroarcula sp. XH51]